MSSQNPPQSVNSAGAKNPNALSLLFHIPKTFSLIKAVFQDARVHWLPKIVFTLSLGVLLIALLVPDIGIELMSIFAGPLEPIAAAIGLPVDGVLDWVVLGTAAINLFRLFPSQVVGEHYNRIFGGRQSGKVVDSH
jgi:hypothetical protein